MTSIFVHHPVPHIQHPCRLLFAVLLALLACLLISETAAGHHGSLQVKPGHVHLEQHTMRWVSEPKPLGSGALPVSVTPAVKSI